MSHQQKELPPVPYLPASVLFMVDIVAATIAREYNLQPPDAHEDYRRALINIRYNLAVTLGIEMGVAVKDRFQAVVILNTDEEV